MAELLAALGAEQRYALDVSLERARATLPSLIRDDYQYIALDEHQRDNQLSEMLELLDTDWDPDNTHPWRPDPMLLASTNALFQYSPTRRHTWQVTGRGKRPAKLRLGASKRVVGTLRAARSEDMLTPITDILRLSFVDPPPEYARMITSDQDLADQTVAIDHRGKRVTYESRQTAEAALDDLVSEWADRARTRTAALCEAIKTVSSKRLSLDLSIEDLAEAVYQELGIRIDGQHEEEEERALRQRAIELLRAGAPGVHIYPSEVKSLDKKGYPAGLAERIIFEILDLRTRRTPKDQDGYQGHFDFSCFLEIIPHYRNCEAAVVRAEGEAILEDIPKLWREVAKRAARTCLDADDWLD